MTVEDYADFPAYDGGLSLPGSGRAVSSVWFEEGTYITGVVSLWIGRSCVYDSDPNAAMIRRDGPAEPKITMIECALLTDKPSSAPGLMIVAPLGQRWR